jgi:hypothetical protein
MFRELAERGAYRIRGRGRNARYELVTAHGNWRVVPASMVGPKAPRLTPADVRAAWAQEAGQMAPGEVMEAWGK